MAMERFFEETDLEDVLGLADLAAGEAGKFFQTTLRAKREAREVGEFIGRSGRMAFGWLESAMSLAGNVLDPFLPGGAGSELRPTSRKVSIEAINQKRREEGLAPLGGGRRRRRVTFTQSDKADIGFITGMISKAAGKDLAMIIAGKRG